MDGLCFDDIDEFGRELDDPIEEFYQDVVHMLFEAYRSNPDDEERSLAIEDALSGPKDRGLKHRIEAKLEHDPRIDAASATLTDEPGNVIRIELVMKANGQELGITLEYDAAGRVIRRAA
jgi:hypothetical protein